MKTLITLILTAVVLVGGCGGGSSNTPPPVNEPPVTEPATPADLPELVWDEVLTCLEAEGFDTADLIRPEHLFVELPGGRELCGLFTRVFLTEVRCVGEIELAIHCYERMPVELLTHEYYHSIHSQMNCGVIGTPEIPLTDPDHESIFYEVEFACNQEKIEVEYE